MTTEYSGGGDPRRSMALLWGMQKRPGRGPKPGLSVEQIVGAAIGVADAAGLEGLSMRAVAERLRVGTMSLYTYVPSKAELLDVMLDTVLGELPEAERASGDWRVEVARLARETWALYQRHPWMMQVATSRPLLGPNAITNWDRELRAVDGIGLSEEEMDSVVTLVSEYVQGAARRAVEAAQAEARTGMSDEAWWAAHAPILEQVFDPGQWPTAARVGAAAGAAYDPAGAFEFGLQRVLDGIEAFVRTRSERRDQR